ncbi:MAG: hypothetical protein AB7S75_19450 [Desulfococcaceae bacterium]
MIQKNRNMMLQIVILVSISVIAGCSVTDIKTFSPDEDIRYLESGYELFCRGDYENAAAQFEIICQGSATGHIRQEALYSLACTRMILAEDTKTFLEALDLWTVWNRQKDLCPKTLSAEDPRMFGPFLEKLSEGSAVCCPETEDMSDLSGDISLEFSEDSLEDKEPRADRQPAEIRTEKKTAASPSAAEKKMKQQIQKKDREILNLKEQMRKMKKEMNTLRIQLNSLEKIHQEIQEKKKDMVSP